MCWRSRVLRGLFCRSLLQELRKSCWLHPHYWQTRSTFITFWKEASANHFFLFEGSFSKCFFWSPFSTKISSVILSFAFLEARRSCMHLTLYLLFSDCSDVGGNLHLLLFLLCHEESLLRAEILLGHRHVGHVALHRLALALHVLHHLLHLLLRHLLLLPLHLLLLHLLHPLDAH